MHHFRRSLTLLALFVGSAVLLTSGGAASAVKPSPNAEPGSEAPARLSTTQADAVPGTGQITVTATAQAVPGVPGPIAGGCLMVDSNGGKTFQNEEYGKKIKIVEDPQNGISIEYTTRKGGTDETRKFEAKDEKELQKKHPEGFKLYQRYLGNVVAGAAGAGVIVPAAPGEAPMPVPFPMPGGGAGQVIVGQALVAGPLPVEVAAEAMGQFSKDVQAAMDDGAWKKASAENKSALKKRAAELKSRLTELEKHLEGEK